MERVPLPRQKSLTRHSSYIRHFSKVEKDPKRGRQTVFITALVPMGSEPYETCQDSSKPRSNSKWWRTHDTICWINWKKAQDRGLQFWNSPSQSLRLSASILYWKKWQAPRVMRCIEGFVLRGLSKLCWRMPGKYNTTKSYSNKQASTNQSRDNKIQSKSTSESKEYHTKQHSNMNDEQKGSKSQPILSKFFPRQSRRSLIYRKLRCSTHSVRSPKRIIRDLGRIRWFELGEVTAKIEYQSCAKYWSEESL